MLNSNKTYTDNKRTNEGSRHSQLVSVSHQAPTNNSGSVTCKCELKHKKKNFF